MAGGSGVGCQIHYDRRQCAFGIVWNRLSCDGRERYARRRFAGVCGGCGRHASSARQNNGKQYFNDVPQSYD
jgi:hypothetical protein